MDLTITDLQEAAERPKIGQAPNFLPADSLLPETQDVVPAWADCEQKWSNLKRGASLVQLKPGTGDAGQDEERTLTTRVQAGDYVALEELYVRYSRPAFGLALKILNDSAAAEDAVQDAFLRFWKQPGSYDAGRGRFVTWLLRVVHNLCIDQLRRKRSTNVSLDHPNTQEQVANIADETRVEEEVLFKMQQVSIQQALQELPAEQRQVIEMAFFKGLTHQEIANTTGQPLGTVKSRARQALIKLQRLLRATQSEA